MEPVERWWPSGGVQRWRGSDRPSAAAPGLHAGLPLELELLLLPGEGGAEHRGWELRRAVLSLQPRVISAVPTGVRQWEEGSGGIPAAQRLPAGCRRCKGGGGIHSPISGLCAPPEGPRSALSRLTPAGALSGHPQTKPCRVGSRSVNVKEARKHPLEKKKKGKLYSCGGNNNCAAAQHSSHNPFPDGAAGGRGAGWGSQHVAAAVLHGDRAPVQAGATARTGTGLPLQDAGSAVLRCCTQGSTSHKPTQPPRLLLSHCCPCARQSPSSPAASCPCPAQRVPAFLADPRGSSVAFLALLSHITPRSTGMLAAGTAPCPGAPRGRAPLLAAC